MQKNIKCFETNSRNIFEGPLRNRRLIEIIIKNTPKMEVSPTRQNSNTISGPILGKQVKPWKNILFLGPQNLVKK